MKAQKRLSLLLVLLLVTLNVTPISAQTKKRSTKSAPSKLPIAAAPQSFDDREAIAAVDKLLAQTGQKYTKAPSGIWIIPRNGAKLRSFQLVLSYTAGTLTTEVRFALGKSAPRLHEVALNLLSLANRLPYAKICMDKQNDLYVRNEAGLKSLSLDEFKTHIESVAAAADQVYVELLPIR